MTTEHTAPAAPVVEVDTWQAPVEDQAVEDQAAEAAGQSIVGELIGTATQRDWLLIQQRLDADKETVLSDMTRLFVALVWLKRKREAGGAKFDPILDLTDEQIYAELGIDADTAAAIEADQNADDAGDGIGGEATDPNGSPGSGTATAPDSASHPVLPRPNTTG